MPYSHHNKIKTDHVENTKYGSWVTDRAWISGLVGALSVIGCAIWFNVTESLVNGLRILDYRITNDSEQTILAALLIITATMLTTELIRLYLYAPKRYFVVAPGLKSGHYLRFLFEVFGNYVTYLCLFWLIKLFFQWAGEYGYQKNALYYRPWFIFLDMAFTAYLWAGLPYVFITRALKHNPEADKNDPSTLIIHMITFIGSILFQKKNWSRSLETRHKKVARGLAVKLFFTPLMTVFFLDQFPHLINNIGYMINTIPTLLAEGRYPHRQFNTDLFNLSITLIFSIDIALAWCGYVISSRWVDNQTRSAEPTMLGWVVCLCCYPPFQMFLGLYFAAPGEREVLRYDNQWLISVFTSLMLLSYLVYMCSTLWFGVRFSNLTNRGIIRTGPYAIVRHPAYAAKNFAWWCIMFPAILYNITHTGLHLALTQILGLSIMTGFYYFRAITEERHLNADDNYISYCEAVKYRFIPGLI